jgi:hypothetical protein
MVTTQTSRLLIAVAVAEALTGVVILLVPGLASVMLFGSELDDAGEAMARVAGILLVAIGGACWPGPGRLGMIVYGGGVTLLLAALGLLGQATGPLLWPAVAVHVVLTGLLLRQTPRRESR